ncbi:MAG: MurT ligase domain-containing protein [Firmicutes bacterium]|nr:MurT ligase domain-containing protein [Bacillota bacterium]
MLRYYIALWAAKLSLIALKITKHNGTNFPGIVALRICPDFLKRIAKPETIIGVTGTNGKTTTSNLIKDALAVKGVRVLSNSHGSNIASGVATSFMNGVNIFGKCKYKMAVLEIDERSVTRFFPAFQPDYLIINNLTRDSIMRNGHPEYIAGILTKEMPAKTKLIINGDDLIACSVAPDNERKYFGIDRMDTDVTECINLINDMMSCPQCNEMLKYEYLRYHHIGKAYCPACGFKSPECDYLGVDADTDAMTISVREKANSANEAIKYKIINDSVFNIYNVVALVALLREIGYCAEDVQEMLDGIEIVKTRFNEKRIGSYTFIRQMSKEKNALASTRVFDYVSTRPGDKELVLMMNCLGDTKTWSENMCWLYDCDFEFLNNDSIKNIIVTGERSKDYYLRLKYAGVPDERITIVPNERDIPSGLKLFPESNVYLFYGTDSLELSYVIADAIEETMRNKVAEGGNR